MIREEEKRSIKSNSWESELTKTGAMWRERMKSTEIKYRL